MTLTRTQRMILVVVLALPVSFSLDYAFRHDNVLAALAGGIGIYYLLKLAARNFGRGPEDPDKGKQKKKK